MSDTPRLVFKPFVDILYSIAIGLGFNVFPPNPASDMPATILFITTLGLALNDWYFYRTHSKDQLDLRELFPQILTILALSQMFRHSADGTFEAWCWYAAMFAFLGSHWNWIHRYNTDCLISGIKGVVLLALAVTYDSFLRRLSGGYDRWLVSVAALIALVIMNWPLFSSIWRREAKS